MAFFIDRVDAGKRLASALRIFLAKKGLFWRFHEAA